MSLSTILALVDPRYGAATMRLAGLASKALLAPVDALVVKRDPRDAIPAVGEGLSGDLIQQIMDSAEADAEASAKAARAAFEATSGLENAKLIERTGRAEEVVARLGRTHGLTILPAGLEGDAVTIDAALFQTGRPALFAPIQEVETLGQRVAVFWNDSAEAAKALWGAMPFIRQAETVKIFSVGEEDDIAGALARVGEGLARSAITVETVAIPPGPGGASRQLTDAAAAMDADLVVMGAYTHSRLRELVLGGVTQSTLEGLARPTLMAH